MKLKLAFISALVAAAFSTATAQISIATTTPVTQNFDSMGAALTLPANWKMGAQTASPTWASAATVVTQQASSGMPTQGGTYNFGSSVSERAVGAMTSGGFASPNSVMAFYQNTNAAFLTGLAITYNAERYRINSANASIQFYYSFDGIAWTAVTAGDVAFTTGASAYNFTTGTTVPVSFSITGLSVPNAGNIYLRWNFDTIGSNSQGIAIDDVSVTASFSGSCSAPATQASTLTTTATTTVGASFSWTNGGATSGSMIVIRPTAQASAAPVSGTSYAANTNYVSAAQINTNNRVVYRSNGTSTTITGLNAGTQYTATIYAYNDPGSCYNTTAPETVTFYTLALEPTAHPASLTCTTVSVSQINLSFSAASTLTNGKGYIILYRIGMAPTGVPIDGDVYAPGTVFGDATVLGYTSAASDISYAATGLNAGTTYYFSIVPFGASTTLAQTYNYRTAATIRTTFCTTVTSPEINITGLGQTINPGNTPIFLDNTLYSTQAVSTTSAPKSFVIQNLGNANLFLLGGSPYVTLGGANASDFTISTPASTPVAPSSSSTFAITFTPSAIGIRTATVTVNSNDTDEAVYTFNIQGSGDDREIDVFGNGISIVSGSTPASTANNTQFGNVNIASGSATQTYAVFNTGGLNLTVSNATISGANAADFTITSSPVGVLAQNASNYLTIVFDPSTIGVKNATVTIANDDANEGSYTFAIQGTGIDYIDCGLGIFETIAQQDFEVAPAAPVMTYTFSQEAGAGVAVVAGGTNYGASRAVKSNMFSGGRSFQNYGYTTVSNVEKTTTVTFATVDASAYTNVNLTFKLGAYSTNTTQGLDSADEHVLVYISTNGGTTWSLETGIYGFSNSIWDINSSIGAATGTFDGNNIPVAYGPMATTTNAGPRTITINSLPNSSQLRVRIEMALDRSDEIWVIDDVKFQGKKLAETTWNGSSWSNGAPVPGVKAIINGAYNTVPNGSIQTCRCQVNAGFTVNVASGDFLEIQDNLLNGGTVNIASGGSLVQVNANAVNSGTIIANRDVTIRKYDYVYWSAPVANFAVQSVSPGTASNYIFKWQPTVGGNYGTWVSTAENMLPGKGYILRGPSAFPTTPSLFSTAFTGNPNNGTINAAIERGSYTGINYTNANGATVTNQDDNWNLLGNPYPSAIKALDFINANGNIEGAVRLWTHGALPSAAEPNPFYNNFLYNYNTNDYIVFNGTATTSGPTGFNGYIASGQGFFVQMIDGPASVQSVIFANTMRSRTYGNSQFYRPAQTTSSSRATSGDSDEGRIWLDLIGPDGMVSRTVVGYVAGATQDKDRIYDAYGKRDNTINFYSLIGIEAMAIQGRAIPFDNQDAVPMGMRMTSAGSHRIAIAFTDGFLAGNDIAVYIEDVALGIVHDLRQSPYDFDAAAGLYDDRFILRYTNRTLANTDFVALDAAVVIATDNKEIAVKSGAQNLSEIAIFDLLGRQVFKQSGLDALDWRLSTLKAARQTLIVKITLIDGSVTSRKIIW